MAEYPDELQDATKIVRDFRRASASLLQRRLKIDYSRADELLVQLEQLGIISPPDDQGQWHVI